MVPGNSSAGVRDLRRIIIHPDFWYPVARSKDLEAGRILGVTFNGDPIALARTEAGEAFALEDRCAHRQVPLHLGVVENGRIKCGYHGWRYDRTGRVCGIPYLPKDAPRLPRGVRSYPVREAYGLVFVFPGEPRLSERVALPLLPGYDSPEHVTLHYSRRIRCHYTFMHENLMDMNHQFLHRRVMGFVKPVLLNYCRGDTWAEARYRFERVPTAKYLIGADFMIRGGQDTKPVLAEDSEEDRHQLMTVRTEYPYQRLAVQVGRSELAAFDLWAAYVPLDREQKYNQSFGILMIRKPRRRGLIYLLLPFIRYFTLAVFREDQMIVEAEQRAWDEQGADRNTEVFPAILALRDVLARNGIPLDASAARPAPDVPAMRQPVPSPADMARPISERDARDAESVVNSQMD
ncbi:MAG: Rieske 2Fe-2S domain-containing protein [Candidatus Binatia bacterium]